MSEQQPPHPGPPDGPVTSVQKKALLAAWLGWMFDGLDGYLYVMVAGPFVTHLLGKTKPDAEVASKAAIIQAVFLVGWALGGAFFGRVGDRLGRCRTRTLTILVYAVFTGLQATATQWWHLLIFRFLAALGIGGEWAAGSALVSETLPVRHRAWASAVLQSGYQTGCIAAALTSGLFGQLLEHTGPGWQRWVFVVGVLPAFVTLWMRRAIPEPHEWSSARTGSLPRMRDLFKPGLASTTLLTLALTSACDKKRESDASLEGVRSENRNVEGSLADNVAKVQAGPYREDCESSFDAKQREIALALDQRAKEIEEYRRNNASAESAYIRVDVAGTYVRERKVPKETAIGWRASRTSWQEAINDYEAVKAQPVNMSWAYLSDDVRSLVVDDIDRVVKGYNYYLDKDSGAPLFQLKQELEVCSNNPSCLSLSLSQSSRDFAMAQPDYRWQLNKMESESGDQKRERLGKLLNLVTGDARAYEFKPNSTMRQVALGQYEQPVDFGPFALGESAIRRYVETIWTSGTNQVRIVPKGASLASDIFRLLLGDIAGNRAYVNQSEHFVMLYPGVRARAIAHEFGHVFGFRDTYYTVWRPDYCGYETQDDLGDLMSEIEGGQVLPSHWDELAKHYPKN